MNTSSLRRIGVLMFVALAFSPAASAAEIQVAVASNFRAPMEVLALQFEARTPHKVVLIFGSTGKQYAQAWNGAPFDAFFSADAEHPQLLESGGLAVPGSRFTYAFGHLVLWSPRADYVDADGAVLSIGNFRHLAIANPELAPYGRAAREALESLGLWESLSPRIVRGENIAQTFQFVDSGNAELGFVASSQVRGPGSDAGGSFWNVPESLHQPIEQQAVLLHDNAATRELMQFVRSTEALATIREFGYSTP